MRPFLILFLLASRFSALGQCPSDNILSCKNEVVFIGNTKVNQLDSMGLKTGIWIHVTCDTGATEILDSESFNQSCDCINRKFDISSIGEFDMGEKDGSWEFFNENKTIAAVSYHADELTGVFTLYKDNQILRALIGGKNDIHVLCNSMNLEDDFHESSDLEILLIEWLRKHVEKKNTQE